MSVVVMDIKIKVVDGERGYWDIPVLEEYTKAFPDKPEQQIVDIDRVIFHKFCKEDEYGHIREWKIGWSRKVANIIGMPLEIIEQLQGKNREQNELFDDLFKNYQDLNKKIISFHGRRWYKKIWMVIRGEEIC